MNNELLSKNEELVAEIIQGDSDIQEFEFKLKDKKITLNLKPLNSDELLQLQKAEKKGMAKSRIKLQRKGKTRTEIRDELENQVQDFEQEIDQIQIIENVAKTKTLAINLSSSLLIDSIKKLPSFLVDDIFEKIMEISEITSEELTLLENFRKD
ncbi:MAG: hypothetical protein DDT29_01584 [Dehalococcoidia bacterium]|nr:hypothetical protein [Bacillota bacterium]